MKKYTLAKNIPGDESGYESDDGEQYTPKTVLGTGSYSIVRSLDSRSRRLKAVLQPRIPNYNRKEIARKKAFFEGLYGKTTVSFFHFKEEKTYRLVVPRLPGVPYNKLQLSNDPLQQIKLMLSAVEAIEESHSKGIILVDFKENNILYDQEKNKSYLIDGGSSATVENPFIDGFGYPAEEIKPAKERNSHLAPECFYIVNKDPPVPILGKPSMDVYALGNTIPYLYHDNELNPTILDLCNQCQNPNPEERPTLAQIKEALLHLEQTLKLSINAPETQHLRSP